MPSKSGGMPEQEHLARSAPKRIDRELTELLKAVDDKTTVQMVRLLGERDRRRGQGVKSWETS